MALLELLPNRRARIVERFNVRVRANLVPDSVPRLELVDHIPQFIDEIVAALREDAGVPSVAPNPEEGKSAAIHGAQRLRLGFSVEAVVREYGELHAAILDVAREGGDPVTMRESDVLYDSLIVGIAHAVAEYALQRDAELARQRNEHFAFIAHELRNPLSSALLAVELLKGTRQLLPDTPAAAALERGLRRANELVDEALSVARHASGITLQKEPLTLAQLFEEAMVGSGPEANARDVTLRSTIRKDAPFDADLRLLHSAVGNLVRNAVKYTGAGTDVELRGRVDAGRVLIEIEDCCGGLPPGTVEHAFAAFVRMDERHSTGFGLGLAIAKQAADAHGGTIRVQDLPGKGCVFTLELPLVREGLLATT